MLWRNRDYSCLVYMEFSHQVSEFSWHKFIFRPCLDKFSHDTHTIQFFKELWLNVCHISLCAVFDYSSTTNLQTFSTTQYACVCEPDNTYIHKYTIFWDGIVLCSPCWPWTLYPPFTASEFWNYRHVLSCLTFCIQCYFFPVSTAVKKKSLS